MHKTGEENQVAAEGKNGDEGGGAREERNRVRRIRALRKRIKTGKARVEEREIRSTYH